MCIVIIITNFCNNISRKTNHGSLLFVHRYEADTGEYEARLTLVWNRDHIVDSRSLTLYKCSVLGAHRGHADCSLCVTRQAKYKCSWCASSCNYSPTCPASARPLLSTQHEDHGLLASESCPTPRIDMVSTQLLIDISLD